MTILGITGTQHGPTIAQRAKLASLIRHPTTLGIHHGDCVGVDEEAHWIAYQAGKDIDVHPPIKDDKRAFCNHSIGGLADGEYRGKLTIHPPAEYLMRDRMIARKCTTLIAVPQLMVEELRSGTWYTVRQARKIGRKRLIIWPNGTVQREGE